MMPETLPEVGKMVDRAAILAYAAITDDFNPLHVDGAFAASTPFGRPIAHGMLSLNLVWQSLRRAFGEAMPVSLEVRFVRPVLQDTLVTAGGRRHPRARRGVHHGRTGLHAGHPCRSVSKGNPCRQGTPHRRGGGSARTAPRRGRICGLGAERPQ